MNGFRTCEISKPDVGTGIHNANTPDHGAFAVQNASKTSQKWSTHYKPLYLQFPLNAIPANAILFVQKMKDTLTSHLVKLRQDIKEEHTKWRGCTSMPAAICPGRTTR
jgi:hypothetical protein